MSTEIQPSPTEIPASRIMRERDAAQGELARLTAENASLRYERNWQQAKAAIARADMKTLQAFVRAVWEEIHEATKPDIDTIRTLVDELVGEDIAGEDCHACDGKGAGRDEIPDAFGVQVHEGACPSCDGMGRVCR